MFDEERDSRIHRWAKGSSHVSKFLFQNCSRLISRWCANVAYSLGKCEFEPEAIPPKILLNSLSRDVFSQTDLTYLGSPLQTVPPSSTSTCTCAASRRLTTSKWYFSNRQKHTYLSFPKKIFFSFFLKKNRNTVFRSPSGSNGTTTGWLTTT